METNHLSFIETCIDSHKQAVLKDTRTGEAQSPPITYIMDSKGTKQICPIMTGPHDISPMNALKTIVKQTGAVVYLFAGEAWFKDVKKSKTAEADTKRIMTKGLKDEPDKQECIIFSYGVINGEKGFRRYSIARAKDTNRIIELNQIDDADTTTFESNKTP